MENILERLLLTRHYVLSSSKSNIDNDTKARYNAFLLSNFGIIVDKPELLNQSIMKQIDALFQLNVPASFYKNPQDTKYYTKTELFIEQLVSYFLVESGTGIYDRVEMFKKNLPEYVTGDEIVLRKINIISEDEANEILKQIGESYCNYTRPFSLDENEQFIALLNSGLISDDAEIKCKDNIINILLSDSVDANKLVTHLDRKDIVKMSISFIGERANDLHSALDNLNKQQKRALMAGLVNAKKCSLTKKQSKYFNKLIKAFGLNNVVDETVPNSPYKTAMPLVKEGNVVEAAKIFAKNGSLLERNLKMLLSRASYSEMDDIIDLVEVKNPIVLLQLINTLGDDSDIRTFNFTSNNKVKHHTETEYEAKWRKSRLDSETIEYLRKHIIDKIFEYYKGLGSLGKVYINQSFYKIGIPTSTATMGSGIDVLPIGSRIPINSKFIRTFVTWKDAFDIDASILTIDGKDAIDCIYFGNYAAKYYGDMILFSGDCRDRNGTEYYDIDIEKLKSKGFKYAILTINGYGDNLNSGEIYCGYQNKDNIMTTAWDPKNIAIKFKVKGDSRAEIAFAIDLTTNEMIVINQMQDSVSRVITTNEWQVIKRYLDSSYLDLNVGNVIEARSNELVDNPEEADIVFDNYYEKPETVEKEQKIVRSFDIEKLISIINEK